MIMFVVFGVVAMMGAVFGSSYNKNWIEDKIRQIIVKITDYLPVKIIRDDKGVPFLYRYHILSLGANGPGLCIHRFVRSDPDRGYHDHPWSHSLSFILAGGYEERIFEPTDQKYAVKIRPRWSFNYLNGHKTFHRVMIEDGKDSWSIFCFQKRSKTWGMKGLDGQFKIMSPSIHDTDGGWWKWAKKGFGLSHRLPLAAPVIATVDIILLSSDIAIELSNPTKESSDPMNQKVLLIKRGKEPYQNCWAFPGGRIEPTDDNIHAAALRELKEETGISDVPLQMYTTIGNKFRDPRAFCVTTVFAYRDLLNRIDLNLPRGDDAIDISWFPLTQLPVMAFDHAQILEAFLKDNKS